MSDTIIISGSPRAGTTWLMEVISILPNYKTIFEPLHKGWFPEVEKIGLGDRPYLPPDKKSPKIYDYFEHTLTGRILSRLPHFPLYDIPKRLISNKLIVKFVRANRLLPWIAKNFKVRGIYYIIRHPCATISSQLKSKCTGYLRRTKGNLKDVIPDKKLVLKEALKIPEIRKNKNLISKLNKINSKIEILATAWCLDNYTPLNQKDPRWITIIYENLITNWNKEIQKIFKYIGEKIPKQVHRMYKKPSQTSERTDYIGTKKQVEKWKTTLSENQIKQIFKITDWFGFKLYKN